MATSYVMPNATNTGTNTGTNTDTDTNANVRSKGAEVVHQLLDKVISLSYLVFNKKELFDMIDEDVDNAGYGTVLREDIQEVIDNGNTREQLNLLSKFFSSFVGGKMYFVMGTVLRTVFMNRFNLSSTLENIGIKLDMKMLETEHYKISTHDTIHQIITYDPLRGSHYFRFDSLGYVYTKRLKSKRLQKTDDEIAQWDEENFVLPYLWTDPPLSEREIRFLDKHKIVNVGDRLYKYMEESGTTNSFSKLADYFSLSDIDQDLLMDEIIKWLTQTKNHDESHIIASYLDVDLNTI